MRHYLILILLVLVTLANSLQNQFVWDDEHLIVNNPKINLSLKETPQVFTKSLWRTAGSIESNQIYYRPVLSLFYILNYKMWGFNPVGFHLSNILLHLIITIVIYSIGLILFNNDKVISFIAASIFAIHPVNNEPIGRAGCGEVIFGFFLILSLYFFLKDKRYLSWLTYFLALLSKETAVMLPFALLILAVQKGGYKKGIIRIIPYLILVGIYLVLRTMIVDVVIGINAGVPISIHILTMAVAVSDYIRLLIIPYNLSPFYQGRWHASIFDVKVIIAIAVLTLVGILAFRIRKDRTMFFLFLSPFIMLAPVIWRVNRFFVGPDSTYIAERFLYVPLMFFSLFVSASIAKLTVNIKRRYVTVMWIMVIIVFSSATVSTNMVWKDNLALFSKMVMDSPETAFAHNNLGLAYAKQGRLDMAMNEYMTALRIRPIYHNPHNNIGMLYMKEGKIDKAIEEFIKATEIKPTYAIAFHNLGVAYKMEGLLNDAEIAFKKSLQLKPFFPKAHHNLGDLYLQQDKIEDAIQEFSYVLKINPNYTPSLFGLAIAFEKIGRKKEAVEYHKRFIEMAGDDLTQYVEISKERIGKLQE